METKEPADAVRVENLTKVYPGGVKAVDSISFSVKKGTIFGFLGPNGAGKTSTIKMLITLSQVTGGRASIFGHDVVKDSWSVRETIGYVPQDLSSDAALTAYENLLMSCKLYNVPSGERKQRIDEILKTVNLEDRRDDRVMTFSGGMVRRLEIGQAMVHSPRLLFLDEPTIGLDPSGRKVVWEYISKLNREKGMTIFLTTHYMDEADALCDNIGIINRGKIAVIDTPMNLKECVGEGTIRVKLAIADQGKVAGTDKGPTIDVLKDVLGKLVSSVDQHDEWFILKTERAGEKAPGILSRLGSEGYTVKAVEIREPNLEDAFLKFTGSSLAQEGNAKEWKAMRGRRRTIKRMG